MVSTLELRRLNRYGLDASTALLRWLFADRRSWTDWGWCNCGSYGPRRHYLVDVCSAFRLRSIVRLDDRRRTRLALYDYARQFNWIPTVLSAGQRCSCHGNQVAVGHRFSYRCARFTGRD